MQIKNINKESFVKVIEAKNEQKKEKDESKNEQKLSEVSLKLEGNSENDTNKKAKKVDTNDSSASSKRNQRLQQKVIRLERKLDSNLSKQDKVATKLEKQIEVAEKREFNFQMSMQSPFTSPITMIKTRGVGTTAAIAATRVAVGTVKVTSKLVNESQKVAVKTIRENINETANNFGRNEEVEFIYQNTTKAGTLAAKKLGSGAVKLVDANVGTNRKANLVRKSNKKIATTNKQASKLQKQRKRIAMKKQRIESTKHLRGSSLIDKIKNFLNGENVLELLASLVKKKLLLASSGLMISLLCISMIFMIGGSVLTLGGFMSGMNSSAHTSKQRNAVSGINHVFDVPIDVESGSYHEYSPFNTDGLRGQCTWFVWGRVREVFGLRIHANLGNGGQWIDSIKSRNLTDYKYGSEPRAGSIMVLKDNDFGHVAFVEEVNREKNTLILSEGNMGNIYANSGNKDAMVKYASDNYAKLVLTSELEIKDTYYGKTVDGYIYLDTLIEKKKLEEEYYGDY